MMLVVATTRAAAAASPACDLPTVGPSDVVAGPASEGKHLHIVTGIVPVCDLAAARAFEIALPDLRDIEAARAQLALAGFTRRYGVHQIGFALGSVEATPSAKGVSVRYTAAVDGLDHYQLAYTLYIVARP